jgi:hypothetical protein
VHVGLPITADLQTLPLAVEIPGFGQGTKKNVNKVFLRVKDSSGIFAGPSFTARRGEDPHDRALRHAAGAADRRDRGRQQGRVDRRRQACIRQSDPLPLTVVDS